MIPNFKLYSEYYDLLYKDKDYKAEAAYVDLQIKKYLPTATNLLELASGTGNHANFLTGYGYHITGIERSQDMIEIAQRKSIKNFTPVLADITDFHLDNQFDAAISLFHGMCYLTTNEQLNNSFRNIHEHLKPGGIFAFDFWYGPAVLHHLPTARKKYQQNEFIEISRSGETTMYTEKNIASVDYEIVVKDKSSGKYDVINENHPMRYFSIPEIALIAEHAGFTMLRFEEFLSSDIPTLESWNVFVVLKKI